MSTEPKELLFDDAGSSIVPHMIGSSREIDFFTFFFDEEIILSITEETNDFYHIQGDKTCISQCKVALCIEKCFVYYHENIAAFV